MAHLIFDIYKVNEKTKNAKIVRMLGLITFLMEITFKTITILYFLAFLLYCVYPIYQYFYANELTTFFTCIIPGIDPKSSGGYIVTMIYEATLMMMAYFGVISSDSYFCMIILNVPLMKHLIEIEVDQLNDLLSDKGASSLAIKIKLRNIILMYTEMKE